MEQLPTTVPVSTAANINHMQHLQHQYQHQHQHPQRQYHPMTALQAHMQAYPTLSAQPSPAFSHGSSPALSPAAASISSASGYSVGDGSSPMEGVPSDYQHQRQHQHQHQHLHHQQERCSSGGEVTDALPESSAMSSDLAAALTSDPPPTTSAPCEAAYHFSAMQHQQLQPQQLLQQQLAVSAALAVVHPNTVYHDQLLPGAADDAQVPRLASISSELVVDAAMSPLGASLFSSSAVDALMAREQFKNAARGAPPPTMVKQALREMYNKGGRLVGVSASDLALLDDSSSTASSGASTVSAAGMFSRGGNAALVPDAPSPPPVVWQPGQLPDALQRALHGGLQSQRQVPADGNGAGPSTSTGSGGSPSPLGGARPSPHRPSPIHEQVQPRSARGGARSATSKPSTRGGPVKTGPAAGKRALPKASKVTRAGKGGKVSQAVATKGDDGASPAAETLHHDAEGAAMATGEDVQDVGGAMNKASVSWSSKEAGPPLPTLAAIDGTGVLDPTHVPARGRGRQLQLAQMSTEQRAAEAKARLEKNRQAARGFRARRKGHIKILEDRVAGFEAEIAELKTLGAERELENQALRLEVARLAGLATAAGIA
jgi:hypothetical protein